MVKVLVLNDKHPDELPGAATVAMQCYQELSTQFNTIFCFGSELDYSINSGFICYRISRVESFVNRVFKRMRLTDTIRSFTRLKSLLWFAKLILNFKPQIVVIHKIGDVFSIFTVLVCRLFKSRIYFMHHDFSHIKMGKLYPADLEILPNNVDQEFLSNSKELFQNIKLNFRSRIYRFLLNRYTTQICQTTLHLSSLIGTGFRISRLIPQYLPKSLSKNKNDYSQTLRSPLRIFFASRIIGKGLPKLIRLIERDERFFLNLAGSAELQDEVSKHLDQKRFRYLGNLKNSEVLLEMSDNDFTYACSECLDVGPRTVVESMSVGTLAIVSAVTGHASELFQLNKNLVVKYNKEIEGDKLINLLRNRNNILDSYYNSKNLENLYWVTLVRESI